MALEQKQVDSIATGSFESNASGDLQSTTIFRLCSRSSNGKGKKNSVSWKPEYDFHADLKLECPMMVSWEARAREGLAISLTSSLGRHIRGAEIVLGTLGNTETSLRNFKFRPPNVPGRVCTEGAWTKYWLCIPHPRKIIVGIGPIPGQQCIAVLENPAIVQKEPSSVQNSDSAIESTGMNVDNVQQVQAQEDDGTHETAARPLYLGFRNAAVYDRQAPTNLLIRNIQLSRLPDDLSLDSVKPQPVIILGEEDASNLPALEQETIQLLQQYREACVKQHQRAEKFGTVYVPPKLSDTMPYSDLRRMRANPTVSVLNGMDLQSPEEKEKLEKRKNRFGSVATTEDSTPAVTADAVPSEQAWDKVDLVGEQRMDPPPELWIEPVANDSTAQDEFQMTVDPPKLVHDKIHLFSIDWAAFKQIRTGDLEKHFGDYAPTYVEWLGDLSCNIHFADRFAASRAIEGLSQELPIAKKPDLHAMGWRMGTSMVNKVANDRHGRKGTRARLLMRVATSVDILVERPSSWKTPPGQFSTDKVLGPESDMLDPKKTKNKKRDRKRKQTRDQRTTEEMLNGGLSAGRAGFSAADLEPERSTKKSKA